MGDKRDFSRIPVPMDIEVQVNGAEDALLLETLDISNSGAFIKASPEETLQAGTEVMLQVKGLFGGEAPPIVNAVVVRTTADGFAVRFLTEDN